MERITGILMADLSGYTAMTEIHGDGAAVEIIGRYIEMGERSLVGETVLLERTGDQLLMVCDKADDLARTALELKRLVAGEPRFLGIHAGLHFGSTIERKGHLFGSVVNVTARIASAAGRNQIFCSRPFVEALSCPEEFRMEPKGPVSFKNVQEAAELFELLPAQEGKNRKIYTDPVCHMHLDEHETHISCTDGDLDYFFCSEECRQIFLKRTMGAVQ